MFLIREFSLNKAHDFLLPLLIFFIVVFTGYLLRRIIFARLLRWSSNTKTQLDDIIIGSIRTPFIIWSAMLGIYLSLEFSLMPEEIVLVAGKFLFILGILSVTILRRIYPQRQLRRIPRR